MLTRQRVSSTPYPEYEKVTRRKTRSRKVLVGEVRRISFIAFAEMGASGDWREGTVTVFDPDNIKVIDNAPVVPYDIDKYSESVEFNKPGNWTIIFEYGHGSRLEETLMHVIDIRAVEEQASRKPI